MIREMTIQTYKSSASFNAVTGSSFPSVCHLAAGGVIACLFFRYSSIDIIFPAVSIAVLTHKNTSFFNLSFILYDPAGNYMTKKTAAVQRNKLSIYTAADVLL